jgi:hypothetical protein
MVRGRRALGAVLGAVLAAGVGVAGCGTPLSNQSVSTCYRAIPVGRVALHTSTVIMVDVHRLPAFRISPYLPPAARAALRESGNTTVCAITFRGNFRPGQVDGAPPTEYGHYALVLVTSDSLKLLAAAVTQSAPRGFGGHSLI